MGSVKTTTTIQVPIAAAWYCTCCNNYNFTDGVYTDSEEMTTPGRNKAAEEAAQEITSDIVESRWRENLAMLLAKPTENPDGVHHSIKLQRCCCEKCGKKEQWMPNNKNLVLISIGVSMAFLGIIFIIAEVSNPIGWIIALIGIAAVIYSCTIDKAYNKKFVALHEHNVPIFATDNMEVHRYAEEHGVKIHYVSEIKDCVKN